MSVLPGLTATVLRNGTAVNYTSITLSREASKISWAWEVELPELINLSASDLWTIKMGFAGAEWTRVDSCPAENISGEDGIDVSTRRVSGSASTGGISDLREYCIPKTLVFVNPTWMASIWPKLTLFENMLVYGHDAAHAGYRYFHPRLPGKEVKGVPGSEAADFVCIIGPTTHHGIGRYLAGLIGYNLSVNTPDISLLDTYTVPVGTKWGEAITSIFSIWGPDVEVIGSTSTIVVSDIMSGTDIPGMQIIKIDNPAIVSTSSSEETMYSQGREIVDHVIVTGRKSTNTTLHTEQVDYTPVEIPIVPLAWTDEITASVDVDNKITRYSTAGATSITFGIPGQQVSVGNNRIKTKVHIMRVHRYKPSLTEPEKFVPVEDETQFLNVDDVMVGKTVVKHKYSAGLKPVATIEEEYLYTNMPGTAVKSLQKLRTKTTIQDQFIRPLNQSQTTELLEEVYLFQWDNTTPGGPYRIDPYPMADVVRQDYEGTIIDPNPTTTQDVVMVLSHIRSTDIQREYEDIMVKRDFDHALVPDKFRCQTQILENPQRKELEPSKDEITFRAEFKDGAGKMIGGYGPCYHPPRTVHHDDIDNDTLAEQIADRVFARKNINNVTITIKSPVYIPFQSVNHKIRLGAFTRAINGEERTIPEADYILKSVHETFQISGEGNGVELSYEQTLTVRTRF